MDAGGGSWFRRNRPRIAVTGLLVAIAGILVLVLVQSPTADRSGLLVAILGVAAPVAMWVIDRREKNSEKVRAAVDHQAPERATPAVSPARVDLPRLVVDPAGSIGGGDRAAAVAYVRRLKELPAPQRRVRTALMSASVPVAEDPDLDRARAEFEQSATHFAQGRVLYPWKPSPEDWAVALETLWELARHGARPPSHPWYAWPPGGAGEPVAFGVPPDDEFVRRVSQRFADRPLHIQSIDPRIVWRWLAPAAVRSVSSDGDLPVVLDDWRVSASEPQQLASVEPERRGGRVASSTDRAWGW